MKTRIAALLLTTTLSACGGDDASTPPPGSMPPPAAPETPAPAVDPLDAFAAPAAGTGFQIALSPFKVKPGEEKYWCHRVPVPVGTTVDLTRIHTKFSKGSHHILVFAADGKYEAADGACATGNLTFGVPMREVVMQNLRFLTGSQTPGQAAPEADNDFGDSGVGLALTGGGTLFFQQHFVNTGTEEIDARAILNFHIAPRPLVKHLETFFFFNPFIDIPPHSEKEVAARCTFPASTELAGMVSHMHQHGVKFTVQRVDEGVATEMLYESSSWNEPVPRAWGPNEMLQMNAGYTIEYRCRYQNDTDQAITVGESATDEMCLLIGFHVSDKGTLFGLPGLGAQTPLGPNPCELVQP
jgi:hypothetical protein